MDDVEIELRLIAGTMKKCTKCSEIKMVTDFPVNAKLLIGYDSHCKRCKNSYTSKESHQLSSLKNHLKTKYDMTIEEYENMLNDQGFVCKICGDFPEEGKRLHVDHNHETGKVRALLCSHCNSAIAFAKEDPKRLHAMEKYLEEYNGNPFRF